MMDTLFSAFVSVAVTSPVGDPSGNITSGYEARSDSPKSLQDFSYPQSVICHSQTD